MSPNFFTEKIRKDARYHTQSRVSAPDLLEPATLKLVQAIIADAKAHGVNLMIFETFRSQERQAFLFDQGATKLKSVGVHHYGLACDLVKDIAGEPSWKGDFSLVGNLAHQHGLIWGGDWGNPSVTHSFVDSVHVQRCTIGRQAALFSGQWYPDADYNPYRDG
jgi:D-alanyl-D-alanine carboxypeptidase